MCECRAASASRSPRLSLSRLLGCRLPFLAPPLPTIVAVAACSSPPPPSTTVAVAHFAAVATNGTMSDCGLPDRVGPSVTSAWSRAAPDVATTRQGSLPEPESQPSSHAWDVERSTAESLHHAGSVPSRPTPGRAEEQPGAVRHFSAPSHRKRRAGSLVALLVSEDLAHEMDVYEGVPVSCDAGELRKMSSLRAASRVLGGADQEVSVDDEVDELEVLRRRSIDVSSLQTGSAAPVVNGPRSRPMARVHAAMPGPLSSRGVVPSLFERRLNPVAKAPTAAAASSASGGSPKCGNALVRMLSSGQANGEALLGACAKGRQAAVRKLLRAGVSPASADSYGRSALAHAAAGGHMAVVECLVRHAGAAAAPACLLRDVEGLTPVDEAIRAGHVEVARFLEDEVRAAAH